MTNIGKEQCFMLELNEIENRFVEKAIENKGERNG